MAKLSECCQKASSNIKQSDLGNCNGIYPIFGASGFIKNVDFYAQEKPYIAVVKDGAGVGHVMKLPAYSSVIGTLQYIIPNDDIDVDYLAYAMEHMNLSKYYMGAAIPHIYFKDYGKEELKVHDTNKQKEIVCVLNKVNTLIANRKTQLTKFDELVKARFVELFDSIDNCKISKFSDECEEITAGGDRPKDTSEIRTEDYPYPVFANAATNEGLLCFSREYKIEKPCVTIAARGCTVGFTAIRYEKFTPVVRLISLVPKETVTPIYLKYYIDIKMNIEGNGAAQPQLTIPMIKSMEIMVPPLELQNQFAAFVEQTDKLKLEVKQSLKKLEMLKKALMQQYFG